MRAGAAPAVAAIAARDVKPARDEALGVECAWAPAPEPPAPSRLWLGITAVLLALGAWQLLGRWIYVLLAFLS